VNPLAEPIVTAEGKSISQIEIGKHLPALVSTCAYNRYDFVGASHCIASIMELFIAGARMRISGTRAGTWILL